MPLFREGGPFDKLYNRPIRSFGYLKLILLVVFICNFVLGVQLHHMRTPTLEFLQIVYISCIFMAFFSFRRLDHRYCIPAVFLAIPNFLFPISMFMYMMTAENYCYVRETLWPSDENSTVVVTDVECIGGFPYASGFHDRLNVILMFGVGKLCEFLLLFHVQKSVERERISLEMMSFMAEKDKKVPPIDDIDDEMVVYKREKNIVV
ncbi:hypothetical protein PENTCL1PPCAC_26029 [Pristionchus entomophagus]|uniref:G protein-coupled receptor n=1 Tax=Pristionchus entomophagus TaxID=358040 RepID=A0AAV5UCG8_9BILA|nr:hypothetical protein PENTCL1PPCAC_26029 [Pristionchus entomophagus]